jgi:hypothetical protein
MSCELAVEYQSVEEEWMSELDLNLPGALTPEESIDTALTAIREAVELLQGIRDLDARSRMREHGELRAVLATKPAA